VRASDTLYPQIHLLVFDAAPQALDEHVVPPSHFTVHADRNAVGGEHAGEGRASELRGLVGIEDVRLAVTSHSILQRFNAERRGIPPHAPLSVLCRPLPAPSHPLTIGGATPLGGSCLEMGGQLAI
jgi:hypothetical protein